MPRDNDRICDREYQRERIERAVCRELGDRFPEVRDCLRAERERTGARGNSDSRSAEVERHAKCFFEALERRIRDRP